MSCRVTWWIALALALAPRWATAQFQQPALDRLDQLPRQGTSTTSITPVYSQLFMFSLPDEFRTVGASAIKGHFTQRSVPAGENIGRWSQMITLSGDEAEAFSGRTWPQQLVDAYAARMKKSCPGTFALLPIPGAFVASFDTAVAVASCGSGSGRSGSEAILILVVKGGMDMYSLEWAVRGPASRTAPRLDVTEWTERLRRLAPIRICRAVPNEEPPYPSCLRQR